VPVNKRQLCTGSRALDTALKNNVKDWPYRFWFEIKNKDLELEPVFNVAFKIHVVNFKRNYYKL